MMVPPSSQPPPSTSSAGRWLTRSRLYWSLQGLGWFLYAALNLALFAGSGQLWAGVVSAVLVTGFGLGLTHGLRAWAGRHRWLMLPGPALAARVLAACVAMSLVTNAGVFSLGRLLGIGRDVPGGRVWPALVVWVFNWTVMYLVWSALYFGVKVLDRLREAEVARWRLEAAAREAELKSLQAQVHPHFLFNCLNSLRALVSEDPAAAQQAITRLSNLLRASLTSSQTDTVPLERELAVVRDYLALEGIRFEERLAVSIDVAPDTLLLPVPAMLVQTLVENAIKHGVGRLERGGEVAVRARQVDGTLELEVRNSSEPRDGVTPDGAQVGLKNAQDRLRLLFGARARLELDRSAPAQTTARVSIPLARAEARA